MTPLLDNIVWNALTGAQARFAAGSGGARRYAAGYSPLLGFEDATAPDFAALAPHCEKGTHFYCELWSGPAPAGWQIDAETTIVKMLWRGTVPATDPAPDAVRLGPAHTDAALALVEATRPGPYGPRTLELGEYFGVFDDGRLVAMAGERLHAGTLREVSGVCTHPDHQGRGLARRLVCKLLRRELARGETPFLHVLRENVHARALYARMGFADYRENVVRVVSRR